MGTFQEQFLLGLTGISNTDQNIMALFRLTIKRTQTVNGIRLEKGMSVDVAYGRNEGNPNTIFGNQNGKEKIARAFQIKYAIDVKKACAINMVNMESQIIG